MRFIIKTKVLTILVFAIIFSMYQETPAQKKKGTKKTKPVAAAAPKMVPPEIAYKVSMSKPWTHMLEVEMRVKWQQVPEKAELKMPVWTPGSYLVREYARQVQDFAVTNAAGAALPWRKINKNTWQVDAKPATELAVTYRVYANELTVRTNELNDEHAFWNNAALLMFPKDELKTPSTITVEPFKGWKVATGLPMVDGQANTFRAENFDILYDSPFEVGNFTEIPFTVEGKPHRYIIEGEGNYDGKKLAEDTAKIVEEAYKLFGELPYNDYTFIVNLRGGGGLEHLNSTALQTNRFSFKPESRYKGFLGLVAHEYFHCFNVKRIRPDALGPFDYENENYTKLLWVAEGGTEYYKDVLLHRAGLIKTSEMLENKSNGIEQLLSRPGRFEMSLEDASFDAWIKYYRADENFVNNQISYYDKGEIVNWLLDLTIRTSSNGAKSLDDVMRYLYTEFYKKGRNYTPEDYQKIAETMAGKSLDDFFSKYVRGTEEIDVNSIVGGLGFQLSAASPDSRKAYIGADLTEQGGVLSIRSIPSDTPAYEQGLNTGDQIVAVDGYRANQNFLQSYIADRKPGDKIRFTIFRMDKLRDIDFTLGKSTRKSLDVEAVDNPTEDQKRLFKDYFGEDLQ